MHMLEPLEPRVLCSGEVYLLAGDVTGPNGVRDGIINRLDAVAMSRMAVGLDPVSLQADVTGDRRVTGLDVSIAMWMDVYQQPMEFEGRILEYKIPDGAQPAAIPPPLHAGPLTLQSPTLARHVRAHEHRH